VIITSKSDLAFVRIALFAERKIFIGMIPKTLNEADLMAMFSVYGDIEECTVTRESNGFSKGE
jgi:hypothetical protein